MKDIVWLDWARVIGIFLVVFGHVLQHVPLWQENLIFDIWNWIYLFHMPLFFVISGYLYKQGSSNSLNKIFWGLAIPYLIYQVTYLPLSIFMNWRHLDSNESLLGLVAKQVCGVLLGDGYETPISCSCCLPCWFIVSIIQLRLLFGFVKINKVSSIALAIASTMFLYIRRCCGFDLYACMDSTIMAIPYFLLGFWLRELSATHNLVKALMGRGKSKILNCLAFGVVVCLVYKYNGNAQMNGPSVGKDVILNYIGGCAGTLLVFNISMYFSRLPEYIKLISRNTLFIIFFHWCCLLFIGKQLFVTSNMIAHLVEAVILAILVLIASHFAIQWCGKHCRIVLGKYRPNKFEK